MSLRNLTFRLDLEGAASALESLDRVRERMAEVNGTVVRAVIGDETKGASTAMGNLAKASKTAQGALVEAGNATKNAFSQIKSSIETVQTSITKLAGSLVAVATGGAVAGYSWLSVEKTKLYIEDVHRAIDANKKLGVSSDMLEAKVKMMTALAPGWKTTTQAREELYSTLTMASKYVGRGEKGLAGAEAISKFFYANKEMLEKEGITDVSQLIQMAIRTPGKMEGRFGAAFQAATGLSDAQMKSAKSRMRAFMEMGGAIDIKAELDQRPWDEAMNNIAILKKAIGESLGEPMARVSRVVADLALKIGQIPGAPGLIGFVALGTAAVGIVSLLIGVFAPLAGVIAAAGGALTIFGVALAALATPIGLVVVLAAVLGAVAYKTGMLQKAWEKLVQLRDQFDKAFTTGGLGGGFKLAVNLAGGALGKMLSQIVGYLDSMLGVSTTVSEVTKKVAGFMEQLLSTLKGLWNKLMDIIPGARKEEARQKLATDIAKSAKLSEYGLKYDYATGQFERTVGKGGQYTIGSEAELAEDLGAAGARRLWQEKEKYESLPGFAEGVAEAVSSALSGLGPIIASAIRDGFEGVQINVQQTIQAIPEKVAGAIPSPIKPEDLEVDEEGKVKAGAFKGMTLDEVSSFGTGNPFGNYATGATVKLSGLARIHAGEEVVPAAQTERGPGAIARTIENLTSFSVGGSPSVRLGDVHVHVARMETDMDVRALADKLMFVMRGDLENLMRRNIGYRRGGSLGR